MPSCSSLNSTSSTIVSVFVSLLGAGSTAFGFEAGSRDEDEQFRVREGSSFVFVGLSDYPLTASARDYRENFDPVADNPIPGCTPKGMPYIMGQPYPIEFVDEGDRFASAFRCGLVAAYLRHEASSIIHATSSSKDIPTKAACSGTSEVGVMPGCVFTSSMYISLPS